jgi:integrase
MRIGDDRTHHGRPGQEKAMSILTTTHSHAPWNKGKLTGQKAVLHLNEIYAIRVRIQLTGRTRDLALFNLAIDSKLRGCDLVNLRVSDVIHGTQIASRAIVMQRKTKRPVQFEITEQTRVSLSSWIVSAGLGPEDFVFPSRIHDSPHLTTRQYERIVDGWFRAIGLDDANYGTHTMRRTKASLIYRRTRNLRAVQLLLGHTKIESTVRYLGVELDDALELAEQTDVQTFSARSGHLQPKLANPRRRRLPSLRAAAYVTVPRDQRLGRSSNASTLLRTARTVST